MVILGIDPGTRRVGYGLVRKNKRLELVAAGILPLKSADDSGALAEIKSQLEFLIKKHKPEVLAVEKLYFSRNQKTGLAVAQARGVIMLTAREAGLAVREYSPNEIKSSVTGYGLADKKSVLKMVKLTLREPDLKVIDDASDALAAAIVAAADARLSTGRSI